MIKATTRYNERKLNIKYPPSGSGYDQTLPVTISRNSAGSVIVSGQYINQSPNCDGDELCGEKATHLITMLQYHDSAQGQSKSTIMTSIRNFLLLCPDCLDLYKSTDVMIGKPIDLIGFIKDSKKDSA